jgi:peptidoglycan-associated lipoprotein
MLTMTMFKTAPLSRLSLFGLLLALITFAAGCRSPQVPDPAMTAVRGQAGTGGADWINPEDIASAEALGLSGRDPSLMDPTNRLENLFPPVYFDFDQSFVRPEDRPTLQTVATYLNQNPSAQLLVEGHCDWRGTTEYNMALGDRRANSVTAYMEQLGISADRLETVSKGDLEAITEGSENEMSRDRRADLIIIP